jgi:hypothetical protein
MDKIGTLIIGKNPLWKQDPILIYKSSTNLPIKRLDQP